MPMNRLRPARRGGTLIELLIVLPMASLLAVAATATLLGAWRLVRRAAVSQGSTRELRHAHATLEAELRPLRARDLHTVTDTAVEFDALLGAGVVCAAPRGPTERIDVVSADPADARGVSWASGLQIGDALTLWRTNGDSPTSLVEHRTTVRDISWASACTASPWMVGWADRRTVRLTLADASPSALVVGAAVAARRRTRLSLYRSGSSWYLGKRTRTGGVWDVVQPVAGPLLSPAQGGMSVRVLDVAGVVTRRLPDAAAVRLELRADRAPDGHLPTRRDTAAFDVVLRAESAQRTP
jgi:type II secretory pathway pseudopilin PulG